MILKHPSFWKGSLSLHSTEQNIKHSALGSVMSEANTDVNTLIHLCLSPDSPCFGFLICSSNQFSMNSLLLLVRKMHMWSGSHWSHISRVYIIIPSELFLQVSWTVSVHSAIPILFSKCRAMYCLNLSWNSNQQLPWENLENQHLH